MDGNGTEANDVKNRLFILVSAGMILPAAFLFCVTAGLPHVFVITFIGFLASFVIRKPIKYSDRSIIYSALVSLAMVILLNMVFPMRPDRFFHIGRLLMSHITVPLILYLAAFSTFYESTPYTLGFNAAFALITLMFGGDFRISGYTRKTTLDFSENLLAQGHFKIFFLVIAAVVIVMILTAFNLARKSMYHRSNWKIDWPKKGVYLLFLLIAGLFSFGIFSLFHIYQNEIRNLENFMRSANFPNITNPSGIMFDDEIDLNTTIKADRKKNSRVIMLRVVGTDIPPGYLRGKAYQFYSKGKWSIPSATPQNCKFKLNINDLAVNAFFIDKDPGDEGDKITIYPTSMCYADFLFIPGNSERIVMVADRVVYSKNGNFFPKTWDKDGGYTVQVPKINQFAARDFPATFKKSGYLGIPPELSATLSEISTEIYKPDGKDATPDSAIDIINLTDREITQKIIQFFTANFSYTLEPEGPEHGEDPLIHFLTKTRRGHCELFASSTVMLLRRQGIPARYVTGLLCQTEHPSGKYFVSRLGDAHAWVEAYLRDEKKWIIVETTPASEDDSNAQWGFFESWTDRIKYAFEKILADAKRGYIARAILALFAELFSFLWDVIKHPVGGTIFIISSIFLFWKYSAGKKQKDLLKIKLDAEIKVLQKSILKLEKKIGKRAEILRTSQMSPEEWMEELRTSQKIEPEKFAKLAEIEKIYNQLRFSTLPVSADAVNHLKQMIEKLKKDL
jgi:hypothetical protein